MTNTDMVSKIHSVAHVLVFIHSFSWRVSRWGVLTKAFRRMSLCFPEGPGEEGSRDTEPEERKEAERACRVFLRGHSVTLTRSGSARKGQVFRWGV